jgi:hypothetical protein
MYLGEEMQDCELNNIAMSLPIAAVLNVTAVIVGPFVQVMASSE